MARSTQRTKKKPTPRGGKGPTRSRGPMASRYDRHVLYQMAVQAPDAEIDFVDDTFKDLRGHRASTLREDFCGTAHTSCEWVRRRPSNQAWGVDLDQETLDWGRTHNIGELKPAQQRRLHLLNDNVLTVRTPPVDIVLAMNFSYFLLTERSLLRRYFAHVRESLKAGGVFFMDCYGGHESFKQTRDKRKITKDVTYIWDQADYDPISGMMTCHIHFHFSDRSKMNRAFSYHWRMWSLPEIREILAEAGFSRSTVYWEGTDPDTGEGDSDFAPRDRGDPDPAWVCYIVAEK